MELLLNLVWLTIALAAAGVFHIRWQRNRRQGDPLTSRGWIALACVLVFLFFAISLTDDLHPELVMAEDSSWTRRNLPAVHGGAHCLSMSQYGPARSSAAELPILNSLPEIPFSSLEDGQQATALEPLIRTRSGRDPPLAVL
jgi:hypothetical protein